MMATLESFVAPSTLASRAHAHESTDFVGSEFISVRQRHDCPSVYRDRGRGPQSLDTNRLLAIMIAHPCPGDCAMDAGHGLSAPLVCRLM